MAYAPFAVIDSPARLPMPYGLFSQVSLAEEATERWTNGVTWEATCFEEAGIVVGDCNDPEGFPKEFPEDGPGVGEATAFTVYGVYKCSPIGGTLEKAQERAREALISREEQAAEARLWRSLALSTPTTVTGGDVVQVLGDLEGFIAGTYGSLGTLHVSRRAGITLLQKHLIEQRGSQMLTGIGTPVIVGSGYPGTGAAITETQTVTVTETTPPISGTFTLTYDGETTAPIPFDAVGADVASALNALEGLNGVSATGSLPGDVTVSFEPGQDYLLLTADGSGLTNGTASVAPGTDGSFPAATAGSEWIAASPGLFGYRSQIFEGSNRPGDLLDRNVNDLYGIAERNYLIGHEPCGVAFGELPLGCC